VESKNMKNILGIIIVLVVVAGIVVGTNHHASTTKNTTSSQSSFVSPASADNVAVTGGTNGAACDSGGYFKPADITIHSGESITFSVPANDPYSGGLQVNGLPGGKLVIPRGGSTTTRAITASVSYNGTWPNETSCKKGSGTITVK
jgi:hypothetical protein